MTAFSFRRGFTLLEMLLVVALIGLVAGMGAPLFQSFQVRNDLDIAATTAIESLRRAQALARSVDGDVPWGVRIATSTGITLFKGTSYAARDAAFDETTAISTIVSVGGVSEVVFAKVTGFPNVTGTTTLTSTTNETRNFSLNAKGTINF